MIKNNRQNMPVVFSSVFYIMERMKEKKESAIKELALYYPRLFKGLITMLLTASAGIALAAIVVYPLWSTATHSKAAYNWFILVCALLAIVIIPARRLYTLKKSGTSTAEILKKHILPVVMQILYILLMITAAIMAWMYFSNGYIGSGIISILFILLITGIFKIYLKK